MYKLNEEEKKFFEIETAKRIVYGYLAIKKVQEEKNYGDEMVYRMYGILPCTYKNLYDNLNSEIKKEIEEEMQKEIAEGKFDLDRYIVEMYKKRKGSNRGER